MSSQAMSFSVFSLGLLSSSFRIENGKNSEKSNHMLSATSDIDLEFLTKFLNQFEYRLSLCTRGWCRNKFSIFGVRLAPSFLLIILFFLGHCYFSCNIVLLYEMVPLHNNFDMKDLSNISNVAI